MNGKILFILFLSFTIISCTKKENIAVQNTAIIFDCDPGTDDATALFIISKSNKKPNLIFSSYGNVSIDKSLLNNILLTKYFNFDVKIAKGARFSLDGKNGEGSTYHGVDGIAETSNSLTKLLKINPNNINNILTDEDVKNYILNNNNITYIATSPLTNLAMLLNSNPEIKKHISNVYIMGGGINYFNNPKDGEYNFATDPKAVKTVFESGLNITLFPYDISIKYPITKEEINTLKNTKKYEYLIIMLEKLLAQCIANKESTGAIVCDAMPILYILYPEKFTIIDMKLISNIYGHIEQSDDGNLIHVATALNDDKLMYNLIFENFNK